MYFRTRDMYCFLYTFFFIENIKTNKPNQFRVLGMKKSLIPDIAFLYESFLMAKTYLSIVFFLLPYCFH